MKAELVGRHSVAGDTRGPWKPYEHVVDFDTV
jgi:hypothetical protein